ncbi:9061_t:CDS:2 [Ambispora gerdemannii]|uniref:9061_t:CDS:1 n=1 Tax=Ambispora gerdemannii TaxID=144530 RepID=A0A9N9BHD7_9GLOM|nr:9061_t:CDS:2 [Ambispora gerdemannii]
MERKISSTFFFTFTFFLLTLLTLTSSQSPGPRYSHCLATYKNTLYLFGGATTATTKDFFFSADLPFENTNSMPWRKETTINAKNVNDTACIVEPTLGLLLIIGGGNFANNVNDGNPGLQVYDFNKNTWNDPKYLQNIPSEFSYYLYRPRAALIAPKTVFIWAGTFNHDQNSSTGIYQIDLSKALWNWTTISHDTKMKPTNGAGIAISKGNAFIFGGINKVSKENWPPTGYTYIFSLNYGLLTAPYQFTLNISDGVVGILNSKLKVLVMNDGRQLANQSMIMVPVDLETMKSGDYVSSGQPYMRDRAAAVQFPGSDTILIYGGIPAWPNTQPLDSMLAYNMTNGAWTNKVNVVTNIAINQYKMPTVNGYDLNLPISNNNNNSASVSSSTNNVSSPLSSGALIGIVSASIAIGCTCIGFIIVGVWQINRWKKQHAIQLEATIASLYPQGSSLSSSSASLSSIKVIPVHVDNQVRKQPKNYREKIKNVHVDRVDNEVVDLYYNDKFKNFSLILYLWFFFLTNGCRPVESISPGQRRSHCLATYNTTLYLFGGTEIDENNEPIATNSIFYSASVPFDTSNVPWQIVDSTNAINVYDAACLSVPSLGYLLVIGGMNKAESNTNHSGFQTYNIQKGVWNEQVTTMNFPVELRQSLYRPRATLISPKVVLIYGGAFKDVVESTLLWTLNMTTTPWVWSAIGYNSTFSLTNSAGIASSKGNAWMFGGSLDFEKTNNLPTDDISVYNEKHGLLKFSKKLPTKIVDAAVGVLNHLLYIVGLDLRDDDQISISSLDLSNNNQVPIKISPLYKRQGAAYTQFSRSDALIIYGGITSSNDAPFLIFNMTTIQWSTQLNIVQNIMDGDYNLPLLDGYDINNGDATGTDESSLPVVSTGKAVIIGVFAFLFIILLLVGLWYKLKKRA